MNTFVYLGIIFSFFLGIVMGPLHETGHYLTYRVFGYDALFHYDSVTCSTPIADPVQAAVITIAGWGMIWIVEIVSLLLVSRVKKFIFFSPALLFSSVSIFDTTIDLIGIEHGDKFAIAASIGISYPLVALLSLVLDGILVGLSVWYLDRYFRDIDKKSWVFGVLLSGAIGVAFWLFVIGPQLLP